MLLTQLAVARGARVITTVSRDDKEQLSRAAGASDVIRYEGFTDMAEDLPRAVRDLTDGTGVDVVYDGVGAATFDGSLASLAVRGTLVLFGGASGQVPPIDPQRLAPRWGGNSQRCPQQRSAGVRPTWWWSSWPAES